MDDLFISYSRKDQPTAKRLHNFLDDEGWDVWWDQEIQVGENWNDDLVEALNKSKAIVILWSKNSVKSEWVRKEAQYAYDHNKLFPILLEECDVPEPFTKIQWVMLFDWQGEPEHEQLGRVLRSLAERAPPSRIDTLRPGFDSKFLDDDRRVPWPNVTGTARQLHYLHFSVVMNPARRLAWYVAYNIDMQARGRQPRRPDRWMPDPLVPGELQPGNKHFKQSGYDRGHLASRAAVMWGEDRQARIASHQAFFWTNTAPQHPGLNRGSYLAVEQWERKAAEERGRMVAFAGPVFRDDDEPFRDEEPGDDGFVAYGTFRVPRAYWKVVAGLDETGELVQRAFLFPNPGPDEPPGRRRAPADLTVDPAELQTATGLVFPDEILRAPLLEG